MPALVSRFIGGVSALALALAPLSADANPLNGQIVGGAATIAGQGTRNVVVNQSTNRAIINWNSFNIGANETTSFVQPGASSVVLNRVTGSASPSQINGIINGNGGVYVVNPDGILIGRTATINVGSFLATTHDISNSDFMAGHGNFTIPGNPSASVVNQGTITAASGGFAALVAPGVRNDGIITARLGTVALASANSFTLDLYGDNLITLQPSDAISAQVVDVATGQTLQSLVQNTGKLKANGGTVSLTAVAAKQVVDSVINSSGVVEANTVGSRNGLVVFGAAAGSTKPAGAPTQTVKVSGKISVAGRRAGTTGGKIQIAGENIQLSGAKLNASGAAGGGAVLIGGAGHSGAATAIPVASSVTLDAATTIDASATIAGAGGSIVLWSDGLTSAAGTLLARGGPQGGDGGFVETSGDTVDFTGIHVDTSAPAGQTGTWLVDPTDLTVDGAAASTIESNLATTNVTLQTNANGTTSGPGNASAGPGDIIVSAPISWASANSLTLSAFHDVIIDADITNTGDANVILRADNNGFGAGTVTFNNSAVVSTSGMVSIFYNPAGNNNATVNDFSYTTPTNYAGDVAGGAQLTAYMLVNTVYDLQNVQNNLAGDYALGTNILAGVTAGWNGGAGFIPIGSSATPFEGMFNGQGNAINNLVISGAVSPAGLFSVVGGSGSISNLNLTGASLAAATAVEAGVVAGENDGLINNVTVNGAVVSGVGNDASARTPIGGLVGLNTGTVSNASANASITAGIYVYAGEVVGHNLLAGTVTQSSGSGTISGAGNSTSVTELGGLVGESDGTVSYSSANTTIQGGDYTDSAGLVAGDNGPILYSYATGNVTGGDSSRVGGLVSSNGGTITGSWASGNVTAGANSVVGGLAGRNEAQNGSTYALGTINSSSASGAVSETGGSTSVGGLVGLNPAGATISNSSASGTVTGTTNDCAGGLVGCNSGSIVGSYASGMVTGTVSNDCAGGLVGCNNGSDATISLSYATGSVNANSGASVGGLVGYLGGGSINQSSATGVVSGASASSVGGLVGYIAGGSINQSWATAAVSGNGSIGGLVGLSTGGAIGQSWAAGTVSGDTSSVGGLVGYLGGGAINQSYATGAVSGDNSGVGGLVGYAPGGSISQSWASGAVSGAGSNLGGLLGYNGGGTVAQSYWDTTTSGIGSQYGVGNVPNASGVTGLTTAQFANRANFSGLNFGSAPGGAACGSGGACWVIVDVDGTLDNANGAAGATRPMLLSEYSTTIVNAHQLQLVALDPTASYTLANYVDLGPALTNASDVWGPNGAAGFVPIGTSAAKFTGVFNGQGYSISNLVVNLPTNSVAGDYAGLFGYVGASGAISNVELYGGSVTGETYVGGLAGWSSGSISGVYTNGTVTGNDAVGGLVGYNAGSVSQSSAWETVSGSSYSLINHSNTNGVGGLVGYNDGMVSQSYAAGALSGNSVFLGGLVGYNLSSGVVTQSYATEPVANFDQAGGLAGGNAGSITQSYATGAVTATNGAAGGLVAENLGAITQSYASGVVTSEAGATAGGLVGFNGGAISQSYASGAVFGTNGAASTGGLVGANDGAITASYAIGAVSGANEVGGLVGANTYTNGGSTYGAVTQSYASGAVTGAYDVGGLVGYNGGGSISQSYFDTTTSGIGNQYGAGDVANAPGVTGLTTAQFGNASNFSSWTFGSTPGGASCATGGACWVIVDVDGTLNNAYSPAGATRPMLLSEYSTNIVTAHQLQLMELDPTASYTLASYLDLGPALTNASDVWGPTGAAGFVPIGNSTANFTGVFNGQGYTISNLVINLPTNAVVGDYAGLFGYVGASGAIWNVGLNGGSVTGETYVGGLAGWSSGSISGSYTTGTVTGNDAVGGLVGQNAGSISQSSASGMVSGSSHSLINHTYTYGVGGLVGYNYGSISQSFATGPLSGRSVFEGGLVGYNESSGEVTQSYATGSVTGIDQAGGLAGGNTGNISQSYAMGAVTATNGAAGGLVAQNFGAITQSFASAVVTSEALGWAGGLVGFNAGAISQSYASGAVTGTNGAESAGGLVGTNVGTITTSYAVGAVSGGNEVGGLVGANAYTNGGSTYYGAVTQSYASGAVSGASNVGGLVGYNGGGSITQSYFDTTTSGIGNQYGAGDVANAPGVTGLTTSQFGNPSNFAGWNFGADPGGQFCATGGSCWVIVDVNGSLNGWGGAGATRPMLLSEYSTTIVNAHQLQLMDLAPGAYTLANNIDLGPALANPSDVWGPNGSAGFVPIAQNGFAFNGTFDGQGNTISNLTINQPSASPVGLFGVVVPGGVVENVGLLGGSVTGGSTTGALVGNNSGLVTNDYSTAAVNGGGNSSFFGNVGGLVGQNFGTIEQSYSTGAVTGNPFTNLGGLVGQSGNFGPNGPMAGASITDSYATGAVSSVGSNSSNDHSGIGGLVGVNSGLSTITLSYATGAVSSGVSNSYINVGGLVGSNSGPISQSYATGAVALSSNGNAGGLVGSNGDCCDSNGNPTAGASITNSYATGAVSGGVSNSYINVGGLVGSNSGPISQSYATGAVTAASNGNAGGLVGSNGDCCDSNGNPTAGASITNSYATGAVSGAGLNGSFGGLVGFNNALSQITSSDATGNVSATGIPPNPCSSNCQNIDVGGLVGNNQGAISGSYETGVVSASGSVSASSNSYAGVGGLVGSSSNFILNGNSAAAASITNSYAAGAVNVSGVDVQVGGLVGQNNQLSTITNSYATGDVSATGVAPSQNVCSGFCPYLNAGGLVGLNFGVVELGSYATGTVTAGSTGVVNAYSNAGGLVAQNNGAISGSYATGAVTSGSYSSLGGLVGSSGNCCDSNGNPTAGASITNSWASGAVSSAGVDVAIGGLVGYNGPLSPITNSDATGNVSATGTLPNQYNCSNGCPFINAGGLAGSNASAISGSYATGVVFVVGSNAVTDNSSYAAVGGLVGQNGNFDLNGNQIAGASIVNSYATGAVSTASLDVNIGGLLGFNGLLSPVTNSDATGDVSATGIPPSQNNCANNCPYADVGGLIGVNGGAVSGSFANGVVTAAGSNSATNNSYTAAGGLVGQNGIYNNGVPIAGTTITNSYATGAVNVAGVNVNAGGLVGQNFSLATITNSNATGAVSATGTAPTANACSNNCPFVNSGGLVGQNDGGVSNSNAIGAVTAGSTGISGDFAQLGGLVGWNDGTVSGSFANSALTAGSYTNVGDLVGGNTGMITSSYVTTGTVTVSGNNISAGDLAGYNGGAISQSYAYGAVSSSGAHISLGGLVGYEDVGGTVANSYATGAVTAGSDHTAVAGLVGNNYGGVSLSYANGAVSSTGVNVSEGGLVGNNEAGATIANSQAYGLVSEGGDSTNEGGLAGDNYGAISQSYAEGAVSSSGENVSIGGLVGYNRPGATIAASQAYGDVASTANLSVNATCTTNCPGVNVGGFVGQNLGTISGPTWTTAPALPVDCGSAFTCADGNVSVGQLGTAGGFVGVNGGIISYAFATGNVTGAAGLVDNGSDVTGLAGFAFFNQGQISNAFATGSVGTAGTAFLKAAGFVVRNGGTIDSSFATGAVQTGDNSFAGGFVMNNSPDGCSSGCGDGYNANAAITNSQAHGNVTVGASSLAGGFSATSGIFAGNSAGGSFTNVTAFGAVTAGGDSIVGGLVGALVNGGSISNSSAQNTLVSSTGANSIVGGIAGVSDGAISNSTSSAPVSGTSDSFIGGLVGANLGLVSASSVTATVTGSGAGNFIGGIAGLNAGTITGSTAQITLASGDPSNYVGGVAGVNGTYINETATFPNSSFPAGSIVSSTANGSGFSGPVGTALPAFTPSAPSWLGNPNCTDPACAILASGALAAEQIIGDVYVDGTLVGGGVVVSGLVDGASVGSATTAANGSYDLLLAANTISVSGSEALTYTIGANAGAAYQQSATGSVYDLNIYAGYLSETTGAGALSAVSAGLSTAIGGNTDVQTLVDGLANRSITATAASFAIDQPIITGALRLSGAAAFTQSAPITATSLALLGAGGSYTLTNSSNQIGALTANTGAVTLNDSTNLNIGPSGVATTGALTLNVNGTISAAGAVDVSQFTLEGGNWVQVGALPGFAAQDFTITGGSFLRALGGDGSSGSPYQIADIYGLQGIGSSPALLADDYVLANNIDASGTANWNGGAGFMPIGVATDFAGAFDGQGHVIDQLYINSSASYVGLFSYVGNGATVSNVGLTNANVITDGSAVFLGALAGGNDGTIANAYSTGQVGNPSGALPAPSVEGGYGGLVGLNYVDANLSQSYSTATVLVTSPTSSGWVDGGGLVGQNHGTISQSYAAGAVSGTNGSSAGSYLGGLVGWGVEGEISQSYETGSVTGSGAYIYAGGLVGYNSGAVTQAYSTGFVNDSAASSSSGGLVGGNTGEVASSYWDMQTSGQNSSPAGTGLTTAQLQAGLPSGFDATVWGIAPGASYPYFLWQYPITPQVVSGYVYSDAGVTPVAGATVSGLVNGASLASISADAPASTGANGYYNFLLAAGTISSSGSQLLTYAAGANAGAAYQQDATGSTSNLEIYANYLNETTGAGALSAVSAGLAAAIGGNTNVQTLVDGLANRIITETAASFAIDQPLAAATLQLSGAAAFTQSAPISATSLALLGAGGSFALTNSSNQIGALTADAGAVALTNATNLNIGSGGVTTTGALTLNVNGTISVAGAVDVGQFTLAGGNWAQVGSPLPSFAAQDFTITGGSFLRALGGDGSAASPYQIADIYGLQGIGSPALLADDYALANNIDASGAASWNGGAGFAPIGNYGVNGSYQAEFSGALNGQGNTISGLTINRPSATDVGLFGSVNSGGQIANVGLIGGSVTGANWVGALVGLNLGEVSQSYATGAVSGIEGVGGLIGNSDGSVSGSYATGVVSGIGTTGGLIGANLGAVTQSYATGAVSGSGAYANVGGLIGSNNGSVSSSYASGAVSGNGYGASVGGLVGYTVGGAISGSYATGTVTATGTSIAAGGLVGFNSAGASITNSYAAGAVSSDGVNGDIGGLVGNNTGLSPIANSYATGNVSATATLPNQNDDYINIGGLAGQNGGSISGSYATGAVTAAGSVVGNASSYTNAGGLVGYNEGAVSGSYATGAVTAGTNASAGGLVGESGTLDSSGNPIAGATITNSYATGAVGSVGYDVTLGGLVGSNDPLSAVTNSYATGNVSATGTIAGQVCSGGACDYLIAGGLVGQSYGTISGPNWTTPLALATAPTACGAGYTCASGNVTVGSEGDGGGLVGFNLGILSNAFAIADVAGASGLSIPNGSPGADLTRLGGLAADNLGQITNAFALGVVGSSTTPNLIVGGLVAQNYGLISGSFANAAVSAADNSVVGGLAGRNALADSSSCFECQAGFSENLSATISDSNAYGNVAAGASSLAGGLVGETNFFGGSVAGGGSITDSNAFGAVTAGGDSIVGGLVGGANSAISGSSARNTLVSSTGTNSIVGGLVGFNSGSVTTSKSSAPVSAGADSYVGGLVGLNIGSVTQSSFDPPITTGDGSIVGGIAGLNAGLIDSVIGLAAITSGSGSVVGGVAGVNGDYSNLVAGIPGSSFPTGTINNSSVTGTGFSSAVGATSPSSPPALPAWLSGCALPICTILAEVESAQGAGSPSPSTPSYTIPVGLFNFVANPFPAVTNNQAKEGGCSTPGFGLNSPAGGAPVQLADNRSWQKLLGEVENAAALKESIAGADLAMAAGRLDGASPSAQDATALEHQIGKTVIARNQVDELSGSNAKSIAVGEDVFADETVRTGEDSTGKFVFVDETNLAMGPKAVVKLDRFVFAGESTYSQAVINMTLGTFRFITGKSEKKAYAINTPVATVGVRGTIVDIKVDKGLTTVALVEGAAVVCPRGNPKECSQLKPGQTASIKFAKASVGPTHWTFASVCAGNGGLCSQTSVAAAASTIAAERLAQNSSGGGGPCAP